MAYECNLRKNPNLKDNSEKLSNSLPQIFQFPQMKTLSNLGLCDS